MSVEAARRFWQIVTNRIVEVITPDRKVFSEGNIPNDPYFLKLAGLDENQIEQELKLVEADTSLISSERERRIGLIRKKQSDPAQIAGLYLNREEE